nr:MAG TPA: hypothetical protein [Caudoviricetes sp.]
MLTPYERFIPFSLLDFSINAPYNFIKFFLFPG